jgi:hypothetical protein
VGEAEAYVVRVRSKTVSALFSFSATRQERRILEGLLYVRRVLLPRLKAEEFGASA